MSANPDGKFADFHIPIQTFEDLEQFGSNLQCIRDVFDEMLAKDDLRNLWRGLNDKFNQIITVDWEACKNKTRVHEKFV